MVEDIGEQIELLELLAETQRFCGPIELSIGWVDKRNIVQQGIVLKKAPPVVMDRLAKRGYQFSVTKYGVMVDRLPGADEDAGRR